MLKEFDVHIFNLSNKQHEFSFEIKENFFAQFEQSLVEKGRLKVSLSLDKRENIIEADLQIDGTIDLECDLSLEHFDYPLSINEKLIFKYGEEEGEMDDNVMVITSATQKINFAEVIYELICLHIPMKKVHPDYENSEAMTYIDQADDNKEESEISDPRWEALKKLKDN